MSIPHSPSSDVTAAAPDIPDGPVGAAPSWRAVLDARNLFLGGVALGYLDWSGELSVRSGGVNNNFTIDVGVINVVVLYDGTNYRGFSYTGGSITQAKVSGGTLGSAAAWWYVYCYDNANALDFEITTTAPGTLRRFKTGTSTHVYLGCFRANTSGSPLAVRACRGQYLYRTGQTTLSGAAPGAATSIIARPAGTTETPLVPPHARVATVEVALTSSSEASDNGTVTIYSNADSATPETAFTLTAPELDTTSYTVRQRFDLELDSSWQLRYLFTNTTAGGTEPALTINVHGWRE